MRVSFRPTSAAASYLRKRGARLAASLRGRAAKHEIHELFILKASCIGKSRAVKVIEVPPCLGGGYGGQDASTSYFAPAIISNYGPLLNALTKGTLTLDNGQPVPSLKDDPKVSVADGGRVVVGSPPPWGGLRQALNATVGQCYAYPSAILVAVCPTTDFATPNGRTLLITRLNGSMKLVELLPDVVGAGRPAVKAEDHDKAPESIGSIELSLAALGATSDDLLVKASACLEWGPLRGVAGVEVLAHASGAPIASRYALAAYTITDNGADSVPRYGGAIAWQSDITADSLPAADRPAPVSAAAPTGVGYTLPSWAVQNGAPQGRVAGDGAFLFPDSSLCRMWAPSAGYAAAPEALMAILQVVSGTGAANFDAEGWDGDAQSPGYATFSVPATQALRYITYMVNAGPAGALSLVKLSEFTSSRYDPAFFGDLVRVDYTPYLGINTLAGEPRLVCGKHSTQYTIKAAEADLVGPPRLQGEPVRKVPDDASPYVRLADLAFVLISPAGGEVPLALGGYYPALFTENTEAAGVSPAPSDGRPRFGNTRQATGEPRYAQTLPAPFCEYAPGILAVLVSPVGDYPANLHALRIALFSTTSGDMVGLSPVLVSYIDPLRFTLSCFEQGTINPDTGDLLSHARLLVSASKRTTAANRDDGVFAVSEFSKITWLSREPSNVPAFYLGNPLVPATIGVSTNLRGVKPTPIV